MKGVKARKGILGIGNILLRDEGFGVHVVRYLQGHYDVKEDCVLIDGGTSGIMLSSMIAGLKRLLIVDCIRLDLPPGTEREFSLEDFAMDVPGLRMSPHQVGILDTLALLRLEGNLPERVDFMCVVPEDLSTGIGLSDTLQGLLPEFAKRAYEWQKDA